MISYYRILLVPPHFPLTWAYITGPVWHLPTAVFCASPPRLPWSHEELLSDILLWSKRTTVTDMDCRKLSEAMNYAIGYSNWWIRKKLTSKKSVFQGERGIHTSPVTNTKWFKPPGDSIPSYHRCYRIHRSRFSILLSQITKAFHVCDGTMSPRRGIRLCCYKCCAADRQFAVLVNREKKGNKTMIYMTDFCLIHFSPAACVTAELPAD